MSTHVDDAGHGQQAIQTQVYKPSALEALPYMLELASELKAIALSYGFPQIEGALFGTEAVIKHQIECTLPFSD